MELPHPPFFNFLFTFLFSIKALYYFISLFNMLMSVYPYNLMVTTACMSLVLALDYYYPSDRKERNINVESCALCP